jgi:hypothetical protein
MMEPAECAAWRQSRLPESGRGRPGMLYVVVVGARGIRFWTLRDCRLVALPGVARRACAACPRRSIRATP